MRLARIFIAVAAVACSRGSASGRLVDYATGRPIAGASITAHARGWGLSSQQLVRDRSYTSRGRTDSEGRFTVSLPGPWPLVFGGTSLSVDADGYQRITEIVVRSREPLLVQAMKSMPRDERVSGGIAYVGITESGKRFGWNFARGRAVLDISDADVFVEDSANTLGGPLTFASAAPGGVLFLSREQQRIASASYGMFLRYANTAPMDGYRSEVEIDTRGSGGTLFVRTTQGRFAKIAIVTPLSTTRGAIPLQGLAERAAWALPLPFAYNPFPGRSLAYDPSDPSGSPDPAITGAAAELPESGEPERGARRYRIAVEDTAGNPIDSATLTLLPGIPVTVGDRESGRYRFSDIVLTYGERGLAAVRLTIESRAAVYHTADIIPNSRFAIERPFHDYSADGRPLPRVLRIIEVR